MERLPHRATPRVPCCLFSFLLIRVFCCSSSSSLEFLLSVVVSFSNEYDVYLITPINDRLGRGSQRALMCLPFHGCATCRAATERAPEPFSALDIDYSTTTMGSYHYYLEEIFGNYNFCKCRRCCCCSTCPCLPALAGWLFLRNFFYFLFNSFPCCVARARAQQQWPLLATRRCCGCFPLLRPTATLLSSPQHGPTTSTRSQPPLTEYHSQWLQ